MIFSMLKNFQSTREVIASFIRVVQKQVQNQMISWLTSNKMQPATHTQKKKTSPSLL